MGASVRVLKSFRGLQLAVFGLALAASVASARDVAPDRIEEPARLVIGEPRLPPMAHTLFCMNAPQDCARRGGVAHTQAAALRDLESVNARVNGSISYLHNRGGLANERWVLFPGAGDCNDFAVSKRHALLARGWPSHALLLAEVVVPGGKHHLVVVARHASGGLVLDSIAVAIRGVADVPYRFVRAQSPNNPQLWVAVSRPTANVAMTQRKVIKSAGARRAASRVAANVDNNRP